MASSEALMNSESSRMRRTSKVGGSVCWISAMRALIASASATVLTPLCLRTATVTAGLPFSIETDVGIAPVSSTRADVADADRVVAARGDDEVLEVLRARAAGRRVRTDSSRVPCSRRPPGSSRFCARSAAATSVVDSP